MALLSVGARVALALAAVAGLAACYQPTLRDCSVSCTSASDCAGDQVCGADGWCAAPAVAGHCDQAVDASGGDGAVDAPLDAATDTAIDAAAALRVVISGRGSVVLDLPGAECVGPPGDCTFGVMPGAMVTLTAVPDSPGHPFAGWTTPNCTAAVLSCTVTIDAAVVLVGAQFD